MDFAAVTSWLKLLPIIFTSDVADSIREIIRFIQRLRYAPGLYEVLEHHVELSILDKHGKHTTYIKNQQVRFLQDHVIAFQDTVWGDGRLFADYYCSPGKAVDKYREGYRYRVLISLRETKHRGDIEDFNIRRTIIDGFCSDQEYLQTDIFHRTQLLTLKVTFPIERPPRRFWIVENTTKRTFWLDHRMLSTLPDGRKQIRWRKTKPRLHESYILTWDW